MAKHPTKVSWTDDELKKLAILVESGATLIRASAALNRSINGIQTKARAIGKPFLPLRILRKKWNSKPDQPSPTSKPY
ncbi:hypothetical protein [Tardiphaga sp.]|uniref:hypothetical protein n=1 Tax=Tardiphaga sp. TaxID=1926292 RepID=UPI00260C1F77|nr:hypothetical protein [Tardiphaga sp.]MDB5620164.1 hypothetical protein [Tardiphaga sp.]MDB5621323.1 hypothetical protein [Tardiphaga sp.]